MISLSNLISIANRFGNEAGSHLPEFLPAGERWFNRICTGTGYDVWLIHWPSGTNTELHDHGESMGVVRVLAGELLELRWVHDHIIEKRWTTRGAHLLPQRTIHDVRCESGSAVSVHAYSPALTSMTFYETSLGTICPTHTDRIE